MQNIPNIEQGPISVDALYEILGSAMSVPSVAMGQPNQFVVLNEIEALSKASEIIPTPPFTMQALAAVVVCSDVDKAQIKDKWMQDCEAAAKQILLTSHANGLGSYISAIFPHDSRVKGMAELLDLPSNIVAHSYVSLGYPAEVPNARDAFSNERVHYNGWVRRKSTY
jgi:nitroreductase